MLLETAYAFEYPARNVSVKLFSLVIPANEVVMFLQNNVREEKKLCSRATCKEILLSLQINGKKEK